jgi:hypothetical protein
MLLLLPIPAYGRTSINAWIEQLFGPFCLNILQTTFPNQSFYSGFYTDSPNLIVLLILGFAFFTLLALLLLQLQKLNQQLIFKKLLSALRYYLAWIFLLYGFAKIFGVQFPTLDSDNIDLAMYAHDKGLYFWAWLSQRPILVQSIGWFEVLIATALFFKKTRKIGLLFYLLSNFVILNINLFLGIDVKILAALLVGASLFLLVVNDDKIFALYNSKSTPLLFLSKLQNHMLSLKFLMVLLLFFSAIWSNFP